MTEINMGLRLAPVLLMIPCRLSHYIYTVTAIPDPATEYATYQQVIANVFDSPLLNADGTKITGFKGDYLFFEDVPQKVLIAQGIVVNPNTNPIMTLKRPYGLSETVKFLLVPKDPSLQNLQELDLDDWGYVTVGPTLTSAEASVGGIVA